jgi:3',5'-cyclic AMP phosphodiesterase CpdA
MLIAGSIVQTAGQNALGGGPAAGVDGPGTPIVFVGDTQHPLFWEALFLETDRNSLATKTLFAHFRTVNPGAVFILGDVVSLGFYLPAWEDIDSCLAPLRRAAIPVYALLGNHDLMMAASYGEENFQERFPDHVRTGYAKVVDSVAVVMLNSNFSALGSEASARQQNWYTASLELFESDPSVRAIIVCCHHAPYTNSRIVGPSLDAQERFVPPFLNTAKCRLFLAGHAHAFEHFRIGGKDFLTIGGGGGARQPVDEGRESRWADLSPPPPKPMFHYVELRRDADSLHVLSRRLGDDIVTISSYYAFSIPVR